jgi:ParB family chromosome partitioning protein
MKAALGKGLDALIPAGGQEIIEVELHRIQAGASQPRRNFREEPLKELAASIKEKGVLQPVLLKREGDGSFRLIAGERRYRASRLAGLKKIPAILKDAGPEDSLEIALIENIQREDLGPMETARAFQTLVKQFGLTQEQLADRVGKDRATVANYLRLLGLPNEVRKLVDEGALSMGHARAILGIQSRSRQLVAAKKVVKEGLSVREAEGLARRIAAEAEGKPAKRKARKSPEVRALEEKLIRHLGTKVQVKARGKRGSIEIEYYSLEELERLLDVLLG